MPRPKKFLLTLPWLISAAKRPAFGMLLFGALAFVGSATISLIGGFPVPWVHDAFSYLLAADTFASGRVTNPTHPMWQHFETFQVIQQPTYTSKYPPAQGVFLAIGQVLGGHPVVGVWISVGLMCAALYWMLLAWVPVRWALLGGFLATIQFGIVGHWAQSYWGGAVAATGGAFLFGSIRRIWEVPRLREGFLLGLGLVILANSRPFEGLIASIPAAGLLLYGLIRRPRSWTDACLTRIALPTVIVLTLGAAAMGYYNWRTTGEVARTPYQVYNETYQTKPITAALGIPSTKSRPNYRHEVMDRFHSEWGEVRARQRRDIGYSVWKLIHRTWFFAGIAGFSLLMLPLVFRDRWILFAVLVSAGLFAISLPTAMYPHYVAPVAALVVAVTTACLRRLHQINLTQVRGSWLVVLIVAVSIGVFIARTNDKLDPDLSTFQRHQLAVVSHLEQMEDKDLVIVRYDSDHNYLHEWVYNRAQIDSAEIVWAREMAPTENEQLISYFADRRTWILLADQGARLIPYDQRWVESVGADAVSTKSAIENQLGAVRK